ncbi:MAG: alpha/beta hydrolase, partial [Prochlorococcaceae cyanobacterium ETNP18_MAG_1]|nr:alpha/beta hydrolase [Prochlorococcaceae cyanobacterium ETNP18_MAG_1]
QVSKQAKQLTLPTLVIGSRKDKVVSQQGIGQLVRRLDPEITSLHWLEDSGHVITLDQEWLKVASLSEEFLGRLPFDDGN